MVVEEEVIITEEATGVLEEAMADPGVAMAAVIKIEEVIKIGADTTTLTTTDTE